MLDVFLLLFGVHGPSSQVAFGQYLRHADDMTEGLNRDFCIADMQYWEGKYMSGKYFMTCQVLGLVEYKCHDRMSWSI